MDRPDSSKPCVTHLALFITFFRITLSAFGGAMFWARRELVERFIRALRQGLMPITIGLTFASATILMRATNHDWRAYLLTLLVVAIVLRKSWNPLWLLAAGALAGIVGLV